MGSRAKQGRRLQKMMKCMCLREPLKKGGEDETVPSSDSLAITEFYSSTASGRSGLDGEIEKMGSVCEKTRISQMVRISYMSKVRFVYGRSHSAFITAEEAPRWLPATWHALIAVCADTGTPTNYTLSFL